MTIEKFIVPRSAAAVQVSVLLIEMQKAETAFGVGVCRAVAAKSIPVLPQAPRFQ